MLAVPASRDRMFRAVFAAAGAVLAIGAPSMAVADLLYSAYTPTGWQIFACDDEGGQIRQLTRSLGDKRGPRYCGETGTVLFRDSLGQIRRIELDSGNSAEDSKSELVFVHPRNRD